MKHAALVVLVLSLLSMTTTARAALLPHYDLTSLAFQAKNVVRAKQVSEKTIDPSTTERTMVVTANYKGDWNPGATFTVSTDGYSMRAYEDIFQPPPKPPVIGPEMIFFLSPKGTIVASGLRIFRNGKAMRFGQMSNPGGYYPLPQGLDPWDTCADPRANKVVDLAGLEAQLAAALRRSADVKRALVSPDARALAALVGDVIEESDDSSCYDDAVARAILEELAKRNDIPALLDAASRTKETRYRFPIEGDAHERALFAAAESSASPLTSRLAALRLLRERAHFIFEDTSYDARFVALLSDPESRVRAAALLVRDRHRPLSAMKAAIRALWAKETDDRVRVALVRAAAREDMRADLIATPGVTWPASAVFVANGVVQVPWADADPNVSMQLGSIKITMTRNGQARTAKLESAVQTALGRGEGLITAQIVFEPPLASGLYETEVSIALEDERRPSARSSKRTVKLGSLPAPAPLAIPAPVTASTFPIDDPPLAPAPVTAPSTPPAVTPSTSATAPPAPVRPLSPKRNGCGCDTTSRDPATLEALLLLAALALGVARRSHRTRA